MRRVVLPLAIAGTVLAVAAAGTAPRVVCSSHTPSRDNYSGWDSAWTDPHAGDSLTTTWDAVAMHCRAGRSEASPWPGMGDTQTQTGPAAERNLAQLGYDMDCGRKGKATYTAWTEFIHGGHDPGEVTYPRDPIRRGDVLTATLTYAGHGLIRTAMRDETAGWTIERPMRFATNYVPAGVEDIMEETPGLPMAHFSPCAFRTAIVYHGVKEDFADAPRLHSYDSAYARTGDLTGQSWTSTFKHRARL